jgi:hypothetical protein
MGTDMLIKVIFNDKTAGYINEMNLTRLLRTGAVAAFYRAGGWVAVDRDPVRRGGRGYTGPERRQESRKMRGR